MEPESAPAASAAVSAAAAAPATQGEAETGIHKADSTATDNGFENLVSLNGRGSEAEKGRCFGKKI